MGKRICNIWVLDIGIEHKTIFLSQESYISNKLYDVDEKSLFKRIGATIHESERKATRKKLIGSLLWMIQTRPELRHKISVLASDIATAVTTTEEFILWIRRGDKMASQLKKNPIAFILEALCAGCRRRPQNLPVVYKSLHFAMQVLAQ